MVETGGIMSARVISPCEAVAIRYRPNPLAGESLNIGVVLVCEDRRFVSCKMLDHWTRITSAFPNTDFVRLRQIAKALDAESRKCSPESGQAAFDFPKNTEEFLARVFVPDDGSIQFSDPVVGVTNDPTRSLEMLFDSYVDNHHKSNTRKSRTDGEVWTGFARAHLKPDQIKRLKPRDVTSENLTLHFDHGWKNGHLNVLQSISLDMQESKEILFKGQIWFSNALLVQPRDQGVEINLLVGMPLDSQSEAARVARHALAIIRKAKVGLSVYTEDEADSLAEKIKHDLETYPEKNEPTLS
jgi:hypothetical protein